ANADGDTALTVACGHARPSQVVSTLLERGAEPRHRNNAGFECLTTLHAHFGGEDATQSSVIESMAERGVDLNDVAMPSSMAPPLSGVPALHSVAFKRRPLLVSAYLARGARVDLRDAEGRTPLAVALASAGPVDQAA